MRRKFSLIENFLISAKEQVIKYGKAMVKNKEQQQLIYYDYLSEDFFQGMRNIFNEKYLQRLANLAQQTILPSVFGTFTNDKHFLDTLRLVLFSTLETRRRGLFLRKEILPRIKRKDALLDVGAGNGEVLVWIADGFEKVTVVDTNKCSLDELNVTKKIIKNKTQLEKIYASIETTTLHKNHYDLAVLGHVLYYLDRSKWLVAIKNVYESLKNGGVLVVVLSDGSPGKAKLMSDFGKSKLFFDEFIQECFKAFAAKLEVFVSNETFIATSLRHMLHIAGFFLCDIGAKAGEEELTDYVNKNYLQPDGSFMMKSQQKFLLLKKVT